MNKLPRNLDSVLSDKMYLRSNKNNVIEAIKALDINPSEAFVQFYTKYEGPFFEENLGIELMDIIEEINNIFKSTNICRDEYGFDKKYIVLNEMLANEVVVLDTHSDKVYRVDFEGGDELLKNGELQEDWSSFFDFLKEYFNCE